MKDFVVPSSFLDANKSGKNYEAMDSYGSIRNYEQEEYDKAIWSMNVSQIDHQVAILTRTVTRNETTPYYIVHPFDLTINIAEKTSRNEAV